MITVITPTYNRAYILMKAYESLKVQSIKSFLWLIIDDGSTDGTKTLVKDWIDEKAISIEYVYKENGGKASALNVAFDRIKTPFFTILDSDDIFKQNALENALNELYAIQFNNQICGVLALRHDFNGAIIGNKKIPDKVKTIKRVELEDKFSISSEVICFYKIDTLENKEAYFPIYDNEKFVSPAYFEMYVSRKRKFVVLRGEYCYCEYLDDGLTKNRKQVILKNPKGYNAVKKEHLYQAKRFNNIVKQTILYTVTSMLYTKRNIIKNSPRKFWTVMFLPISYLTYLFRKKNIFQK